MHSTQSIRLLTSVPARLKGLLFSKPTTGVVMLVPCNSIHTFGMRRCIDVAFVGKDGKVLATACALRPCQRMHVRGAVAVLEQFSESGKSWVSVGDVLILGKGTIR